MTFQGGHTMPTVEIGQSSHYGFSLGLGMSEGHSILQLLVRNINSSFHASNIACTGFRDKDYCHPDLLDGEAAKAGPRLRRRGALQNLRIPSQENGGYSLALPMTIADIVVKCHDMPFGLTSPRAGDTVWGHSNPGTQKVISGQGTSQEPARAAGRRRGKEEIPQEAGLGAAPHPDPVDEGGRRTPDRGSPASHAS